MSVPSELPPIDPLAAGEATLPPGEGDDPFWARLIGGAYRPSGSGIPVRHLHPLHAKPVFEAAQGTATADVIAGLLFRNMITRNNALHAWERVRELEAERDALAARLAAIEGRSAGA